MDKWTNLQPIRMTDTSLKVHTDGLMAGVNGQMDCHVVSRKNESLNVRVTKLTPPCNSKYRNISLICYHTVIINKD